MDYTITRNPDFNSLEISFDGKPCAAVREALKGLKFRWHGVKKIWYGYADEDTVRAAIDGVKTEGPAADVPTASRKTDNGTDKAETDRLKSLYAEIISRVWDTDRMRTHCINKVSELVQLDNGFLIAIDKQSIKKDFCFGYSLSRYDTEDYDRANGAAAAAREDTEYFVKRNMEEFSDYLEAIDGKRNQCFVLRTSYSMAEDSLLKSIEFMSIGDLLYTFGGCANLEAIKGTFHEMHGYKAYIPTDADKAKIRAGYVRAAETHKQSVMRYLKRYGLSKVKTWSYWRDE